MDTKTRKKVKINVEVKENSEGNYYLYFKDGLTADAAPGDKVRWKLTTRISGINVAITNICDKDGSPLFLFCVQPHPGGHGKWRGIIKEDV